MTVIIGKWEIGFKKCLYLIFSQSNLRIGCCRYSGKYDCLI